MSNDHLTPPTEATERERLNAYLDDLAVGADPSPELDGELAATVRRLLALADLDGATDAIDADTHGARLWETLARPSAPALGRSASPGRGRPLGIAYALPVLRNRSRPSGAARLLGTVAAVLVLVLVALSLYQRVPGGGSTPTAMAAGLPPSPTTSPAGSAVPPVMAGPATPTTPAADRVPSSSDSEPGTVSGSGSTGGWPASLPVATEPTPTTTPSTRTPPTSSRWSGTTDG